MAIPTTIESLSTTAASNGPAGSEERSLADDGLRQAYAFIKQTVSLGTNIASSATITPASTGAVFNITGTTTITAIASTYSWDGRTITLIFAGILTLTHSSNLALPGAANLTTAANDIAVFVQTASGAWRCTAYQSAALTSGLYLPLIGGTMTGAIAGITNLTTTGNTILGNAQGDTLNVAAGAVAVGASGNVTMAAPASGSTLAATTTLANTAVLSLRGAAATQTMLLEGISTTTSGQFAQFSNTGGWLRMGVEGSVGGLICVGAPAYGTFIGAQNLTSLSLATNATERIGITSDGRVYGTALHNNAGAVTGTTNQYFASGTYTPTNTAGSNVTVPSASVYQWMRVGNVVTVSGRCFVSITASSTFTSFRLSLPIASNIASASEAGGYGGAQASDDINFMVEGVVATDDVIFTSRPPSNGATNVTFSFTYLIS